MAENFERGSDSTFVFACLTCQEDFRNTEAEFYCEKCAKYFCSNCVVLHKDIYEEHELLGKENISQWNVSNAQERCKKHTNQILTAFCENHGELICHACHISNHMKCNQVVMIAEKVKYLHKDGEFKMLSATVRTLHQELIQNNNYFEEGLQSLEQSYKTILEEFSNLRKEINDGMNQFERHTIEELDTALATARASIQTNIENGKESMKKMAFVQDWLHINDESETVQLIKYRKCQDLSFVTEAFLQEGETVDDIKLTLNLDEKSQLALSSLSVLKQALIPKRFLRTAKRTTQNPASEQDNPNTCDTVLSQQQQKSDVNNPSEMWDQNKVITLVMGSGKSYTLKVNNDPEKSAISGICKTADGELFIIDHMNNRVKLLDQNYKVAAHCDLPCEPTSICSIDLIEVAIALSNRQVLFIKKVPRRFRSASLQWDKDRILTLTHDCFGIDHYRGILYITSGTALYMYTLNGFQLQKMYTDTSGGLTVTACAVSPYEDRIYVTNRARHQLVTLSWSGKVISKVTDPELLWGDLPCPHVLHVTNAGQVLICGGWSNTILQVDRDGRRILADLARWMDGVLWPQIVYYEEETRSLIVGMAEHDNILVFNA